MFHPGEGHPKGDNFDNPCSDGVSFSILHSLLDHFPARPASAAEYSLLLEGKTMGSSSAHCSPVNALSAVTMNSMGMEGQLRFHCYDMEKGKKLDDDLRKKKIVRAGYSWRGLSFLFLLGALCVFMWVLLFVLGFKIFRCAWNLILP